MDYGAREKDANVVSKFMLLLSYNVPNEHALINHFKTKK